MVISTSTPSGLPWSLSPRGGAGTISRLADAPPSTFSATKKPLQPFTIHLQSSLLSFIIVKQYLFRTLLIWRWKNQYFFEPTILLLIKNNGSPYTNIFYYFSSIRQDRHDCYPRFIASVVMSRLIFSCNRTYWLLYETTQCQFAQWLSNILYFRNCHCMNFCSMPLLLEFFCWQIVVKLNEFWNWFGCE